MKSSKSFVFIISFLLLCLTVAAYLFMQMTCTIKQPFPIKPQNTIVMENIGAEHPLFLSGTLKKEPIPEDLQLGDYWYWLYLDTPVLLLHNATAEPMYITKIELYGTENGFYKLDDYTDKKVEVYGFQTWGYAESSVFQVLAVRTL